MSDKKMNLLEALAKELNEAEDIEQASVFTKEELNAPADVVRCQLNEMGADMLYLLGEFYFLPFEEEEVYYFSTAITVYDELPEEAAILMGVAASKLDYLLPCGAFTLSGDGSTLVYRYTAQLMADESEDKLIQKMLTAVDAAILTVDKFEGFLMLVAEGELTPEEMMDVVMGKRDSSED
ncbi:MAG: hypothetical protein K6G12_02420 [Lachnospiraceae bacterium]|nr:hypothetical protein [Lachnospiraceae bacterium]